MINFEKDNDNGNIDPFEQMPLLSRSQRRAILRNFKYYTKAIDMYGEKLLNNPVFTSWAKMLVKAPMERAKIHKPWLNDFLQFAKDMTSKPGSPCTFEEVLKDVELKAQVKH